MKMILCATLLAVGFAVAGTPNAHAAALNGATIGQAAERLDSTLVVREDCGRHRHWSERRHRCVHD